MRKVYISAAMALCATFSVVLSRSTANAAVVLNASAAVTTQNFAVSGPNATGYVIEDINGSIDPAGSMVKYQENYANFDVLLTCQHVIHGLTDQSYASLRVGFDQNYRDSSATTYSVLSVINKPGYAGAGQMNDLSLLIVAPDFRHYWATYLPIHRCEWHLS